jgi:hypothetical protein
MPLAIRASISVRSDSLKSSSGVVITPFSRNYRARLRSPFSFLVRNACVLCSFAFLGLPRLLA